MGASTLIRHLNVFRTYQLPAALITLAMGWAIWGLPPRSDGDICYQLARDAWTLPLRLENFTCDIHRLSFVSIGLLGLPRLFGSYHLYANNIIQLLLYFFALVSFGNIIRKLLPDFSEKEVAAFVLVLGLTPSYVVYLQAGSLDFVSVTFMLIFIEAVVSNRGALSLGAAACLYSFSKETSFMAYCLGLPIVLGVTFRKIPLSHCALLFAPICVLGTTNWFRFGRPWEMQSFSGRCAPTVLDFLTQSNLNSPAIQNYLFNIAALNFQWILLLPILLGVVGLRARLSRKTSPGIPRDLPPAHFFLVASMFLICTYVTTRCALWNNPKYSINASTLYLLLAVIVLERFVRTSWIRFSFSATVTCAFATANILTAPDPISSMFYGTVRSGERELLCMNSRVREPTNQGCGNDELIYSLAAIR